MACDRLSQRGLPRPRSARNEHATVVVRQAIDEALVEVVGLDFQPRHGPHDGDFVGVGERWPCHGDAQITKLDDLAPFPVDFEEAVASVVVRVHQVTKFVHQFRHLRRLPRLFDAFDFAQTQFGDVPCFGAREAPCLEEQRGDLFGQQGVHGGGKVRMVSMGGHAARGAPQPFTLRRAHALMLGSIQR